MTDLVLELECRVLELAPADRLRLLERLLLSVDEDESIENAWLDEANARLAALERGEARTVDGPTALAALRARFTPSP